MPLTDKEKIFLAGSAEFQELISKDPVLDELDRERINREDEFFSVCEFLGSPLLVGGLPIQPITPAIWSFLWSIGNAYAFRGPKVIEWDTDIFLRLLNAGFRGITGTKDEILRESKGFCRANGADPEAAEADLFDLIQKAFRPLAMLPASMIRNPSEPPAFDADWLLNISSIAAQRANMPIREAAFNLPLSTCFYLWIGKLRENDLNNSIRPRTSEELAKEYYLRVEELGKTFCDQHLHKHKEG